MRSFGKKAKYGTGRLFLSFCWLVAWLLSATAASANETPSAQSKEGSFSAAPSEQNTIASSPSSSKGGANAKARFFTIAMPLLSAEERQKSGVKVGLNEQLREGMKRLLVRITGSRSVLDDSAYDDFLRAPKRWLKQYYYQPVVEEGVTVGQQLVLEFDRQRLLNAFQKKGLIVWPLEARPALLVAGEYQVAGEKVLLDDEGIKQFLNLDYRPAAKAIGLPVVPFINADRSLSLEQLFWEDENAFNQRVVRLHALTQLYEVQGVVLFTLKRQPNPQHPDQASDYALTYELYDERFQQLPKTVLNDLIAPKTIIGFNLSELYEQMFVEVAEYFSQPYRQQAAVLGEVTLEIAGRMTPPRVFDLEKSLLALKPVLHGVKLQKVSANGVLFELTYQGDFEVMLEKIRQQTGLYWIETNAVTGVLKASLTPLEPLEPPKTAVPQKPLQLQMQEQLQQELKDAILQDEVPLEEKP